MPGLKQLLALLTFWNLLAWIFVIIATAVTDWSKSSTAEYGIWRACSLVTTTKTCGNWDLTELPQYKDCEGALTATRAFSVLSIIFTTFCLCLSLALLAKTTLIKKTTVLILLCMTLVTNLWLFLGWIMYLGVNARGHCAAKDYDGHLGSSWFLQLFAWIFGLISIGLAGLIFMKWKKTPRFAGQAPYVPGPVPQGAPSASYPQYKSPYPSGPVPYYPTANKAPYSSSYPAPGSFGPTPNTSPYAPTPYW